MILTKNYGINSWKLNRSLKKLAFARMELEKQMRKELIVVLLEPKKDIMLSTPGQISEIEQMVRNLNGFETLRLCLLEDCKPIYREKLTKNGISRWIEIPVEPLITYEFLTDNSKQEQVIG